MPPHFVVAALTVLAGGFTSPGFSPELEGQVDGRRFRPELVVLSEGVDAVDRLVLIERADGALTCADALRRPHPKIEIAACGVVCLLGATFGPRPVRGAAVTAYGILEGRLPTPTTVEVTVDVRDRTRHLAEGRVRVEGAEGFWLRGPFLALYCPTRMRPRDHAAPIHGVAWGRVPVPPARLPQEPLTGIVAGGPFRLLAAAIVPARDAPGADLLLYGGTPKDPCAGGDTMLDEDAPDTLRIRLPADAVRPGGAFEARSYLDAERAEGDPVLLTWADPERGVRVAESVDWNVTVTVDALDTGRGVARGRLSAAFEDFGKTFLVGAFEATLCPAR